MLVVASYSNLEKLWLDGLKVKLLTKVVPKRDEQIIKVSVADGGKLIADSDRHLGLCFRTEELNIGESLLKGSYMLSVRIEVTMRHVCHHSVGTKLIVPAQGASTVGLIPSRSQAMRKHCRNGGDQHATQDRKSECHRVPLTYTSLTQREERS